MTVLPTMYPLTPHHFHQCSGNGNRLSTRPLLEWTGIEPVGFGVFLVCVFCDAQIEKTVYCLKQLFFCQAAPFLGPLARESWLLLGLQLPVSVHISGLLASSTPSLEYIREKKQKKIQPTTTVLSLGYSVLQQVCTFRRLKCVFNRMFRVFSCASQRTRENISTPSSGNQKLICFLFFVRFLVLCFHKCSVYIFTY